MPVPDTVAEHWLVWPVWTLAGLHEAVTDVIVGDCGGGVLPLPPLPQAARRDDRIVMKASQTGRLEVPLRPKFRIKVTKAAPILSIPTGQISRSPAPDDDGIREERSNLTARKESLVQRNSKSYSFARDQM